MSRKPGKWADAAWVLAMGAQGGLMIALPVLIGLALGFWLDNKLNTLPWISLLLTLVGATIGPIILYRWVSSSVTQQMEIRMSKDEEKPENEREGEEKPE